MRDYNHNGHIYGSVNVSDSSSNSKLLVELTNDDLREERQFRRERKADESARIARSGGFGLVPGLILSIVYYVNNDEVSVLDDPLPFLVITVLGVAGLAFLQYKGRAAAINAHNAALQEIRNIFMERGVE